jgi:hypothetical protein
MRVAAGVSGEPIHAGLDKSPDVCSHMSVAVVRERSHCRERLRIAGEQDSAALIKVPRHTAQVRRA